MDTTSQLSGMTIYELAKHPEIVAEIRKEFSEKIKSDEALTYENIKTCEYLNCVLNEVLRVYAPTLIILLRYVLILFILERQYKITLFAISKLRREPY